jgi:hypothetical protein
VAAIGTHRVVDTVLDRIVPNVEVHVPDRLGTGLRLAVVWHGSGRVDSGMAVAEWTVAWQ